MNNLKLSKAFTLAEVLITLSIIGVIAALTIPALINNMNKAQYVTALKENYALLQQAFLMLKTENGGSILPIYQNEVVNNGGEIVNSAFLTKLNYIKDCGDSKGCWYGSPRHLLDGTTTNSIITDTNGSSGKAILSNGAMLRQVVYSTDCTDNDGSGPLNNSVCGLVDIDINGAKEPNTLGRDLFAFWITKTGIYPLGSFDDDNPCNMPPGDNGNSWGCASRVLTEGAMNY